MERILVINNDIETMSLLQEWLETKSYEVKYTSSMEESMDLLTHFRPRLVLIDESQREIIEKIKDDNKIHNIRLMLMTGYASANKRSEIVADDYIEKPFNLSLLEKKIGELIA